MWNRCEIKKRGRNTLKKAYWTSTLVTLIIYFVSSLPRNINKKDSINNAITATISQLRQLGSINDIVSNIKAIINDTIMYIIGIIDTITIHNIIDLFMRPLFVCSFCL